MTSPAVLNSASYAIEASFAEAGSTVSTLQLALCAPVDASGLVHTKIDPMVQASNLMDGGAWIPGTQEGSFKTKLWLTGHGSTTSGATTVGLHETLIGKFVMGSAGTVIASAAAGTTATGGTATAWTTTASATFTPGSLCRLGALADGRGGGQGYAINTHVTTTLTPFNAPPVAPSAADVIYSAVTSYLPSTTTAMSSARFLLQGKGIQYLCHGCVPTAVTWAGLNTGEVPSIEITWAVAWWEYSTATFPSAVTQETFTPVANASGTLFMNDVGTATSALRTIRGFSIAHKLGTILLPGTGGVGAYQKFVGAIRGQDDVKITWTEDADDTTLTPVLPGKAIAGTAQQVLLTLNPTAGKSVMFYWPNCNWTNIPTQFQNGNVNSYKVTLEANTGTTTTSELTKSAMRMGSA